MEEVEEKRRKMKEDGGRWRKMADDPGRRRKGGRGRWRAMEEDVEREDEDGGLDEGAALRGRLRGGRGVKKDESFDPLAGEP
jgi:hypothetical protein